MTKIFVIGDTISFFMQAGGGSIQSADRNDLYNLGQEIIIVGLFFQIFLFGLFMITTRIFHAGISSKPNTVEISRNISWQQRLWALYATSILILVRSIFSVIEYLQENNGSLISHDATLYIFDDILMLSVMAVFAVWYVGDLKQRSTTDWEIASSRCSCMSYCAIGDNKEPIETSCSV